MIEERINELLPLAAIIAREFSNIPGLPHAEIEIVAQEALTRSAHAFDSTKGDFTAYASTAMRNALRDLYERQCRHLRHHLYELDLPATTADSQAQARIEQVPALETTALPDRAAFRESAQRLEIAMSALPPRLRLVVEGIRDGKSYSEIGSSLGISKQGAHKLAHAAIATLREKLESMGFSGIDTLGLLKSSCGVPPQAMLEVSRQSTPPKVDVIPPRP